MFCYILCHKALIEPDCSLFHLSISLALKVYVIVILKFHFHFLERTSHRFLDNSSVNMERRNSLTNYILQN